MMPFFPDVFPCSSLSSLSLLSEDDEEEEEEDAEETGDFFLDLSFFEVVPFIF